MLEGIDKIYEAYVGCEEWQSTDTFSLYEEAEDYLKNNKGGLGLYPPTEMWIENIKTGEIVYIDPVDLQIIY